MNIRKVLRGQKNYRQQSMKPKDNLYYRNIMMDWKKMKDHPMYSRDLTISMLSTLRNNRKPNRSLITNMKNISPQSDIIKIS